jgi:hypothetical protein
MAPQLWIVTNLPDRVDPPPGAARPANCTATGREDGVPDWLTDPLCTRVDPNWRGSHSIARYYTLSCQRDLTTTSGKAGFSVDDADGKGLPEEEFDFNTDLTDSLTKAGDPGGTVVVKQNGVTILVASQTP